MKTVFTALLIMLCVFLNRTAFSQTDGGDIPPVKHSNSVEQLLKAQEEAKISGDKAKVEQIQKQLDVETGSVSISSHLEDSRTIVVGENVPATDDPNVININTIKLSANIKALATCTESRGSNVGRIWVAVGFSGALAGDTLNIFKSDNGGVTFTLAYTTIFTTDVRLKNDQLDIEIIENTTGDKFLWVARGMSNTGTSQEYSGLSIYNTTTNAVGSLILSWPGTVTATKYFAPRVASDNEYYTSNAYTFIMSAEDSIVGTTHNFKIKYAQCNNPYTTTPTITYNDASIAGSQSTPNAIHFVTDIAFFRNGADSLVIVSNNRGDSTQISVRSFKRSDALNSTIPLSFNLQPSSTGQTMFPALGASGVNNIMLVYRINYQNSGDWDIRSYLCKNGIATASNWVGKVIDNTSSTTDVPGRPDVIGVKLGTGSFKSAYVVSSATGILKYASYNISTNAWGTPLTILPTGASQGSVPPVSGYRNVSGDSCFISYAGFNGVNAYTAAGCTGSTIGVNDPSSEVPADYMLSQNYPNPFNPSTSIRYAIPVRGAVKISIFNTAGKEVATLVNGVKEAGSYIVDFNASGLSSGVYFYKLTAENFSEVKKMMLIK